MDTPTSIRTACLCHGQAMSNLRIPQSLSRRSGESRQPFPAGQDDTQGGCQVPEEGDFYAHAAFLCLPTTATAKEIVGQNPHAVQCRTPSPGNPREEDLSA